MRKIYSFMVAAVALFSAASCNKEFTNDQENLPVGETVVYTASVEGADSKAALNETTKKSEWVANDAITVIDETGKNWDFTTASAGQNVEFSNSEGFGEYRPVLAVYPKGTYTASVTDKTVNAFIPTFQGAREGSYNETAALAIAYSENNSFAFKNAHALIKFSIKGAVKAIEFCGNNNEAITGNMSISLNDDNSIKSVEGLPTDITVDGVTENKLGTWVKLYSEDEANGWCFKEGTTYYAAIAPANFTTGFSVNLILADDSKIEGYKKFEGALSLKANQILPLGEIEYAAPVVYEWAVAGTFNGWNTTATPMTLEDDYYVAKNITGLNFSDPNPNESGSSTGIKFFNNGETWRGGEGKVIAGTWAYVWGDGGNIYVDGATADKAYDIYLNPAEGDYGKFVIVAAGDPMPEDKPAEEPDPTPDPEQPVTPGLESEWAIVGAWTEADGATWREIQMLTTSTEGVYVAEGVVVEKDYTSMLVKKFGDTTWTPKYGGGITYFNPDNYMTLHEGGSDISITKAGTYDFYFDFNGKKLYVVTVGADYAVVPEQTENGEEPKQEEPEVTEKVVYLKPNSNWTQSNARFAAYFWGGTTGEKWVSMTAVGDGTYEAHLPEGYDYGCNIIFCRMNPSTTANNWNNKWNQTSDLKTQTDGKNLYTVKAGTWDKGGGTWSVK